MFGRGVDRCILILLAWPLTRYGMFASALLTMIKFIMRKRVRILDS